MNPEAGRTLSPHIVKIKGAQRGQNGKVCVADRPVVASTSDCECATDAVDGVVVVDCAKVGAVGDLTARLRLNCLAKIALAFSTQKHSILVLETSYARQSSPTARRLFPH